MLALAELSVLCDADHDVGRDLRVVTDRSLEASRTGEDGLELDADRADFAKLAIASLALVAAIAVARGRRVPAIVPALLAAGSLGAYTGFGAYHHGRFVHDHDVFHYFVGAKYFPALGYDRLYACASVAEAEAGFPQRVGLRPLRDLATNHVVSGEGALGRAAECHGAFTEQGWHDFARDVRAFANASGVAAWNRVLKDHGFNASPAWIAPARAVVSRLSASSPWVLGRGNSPLGIAGLDPLLLLAAFGVTLWAFGPLPASLAVVVFGCNPLSEFSWVGGGFLRQLWFATLLVAIGLLHRRRWLSAGIGLGLAAALQLFPAVCLAGIALPAFVEFARTRRIDPGVRRALSAAVITLALVVPLSTWGSGRSDAWSAFAANTRKHAATPSANLVGLPAALSFRMDTRASVLFDASAVDGHAPVRQARLQNYRRVRAVHWISLGVGLWLFARRARRSPMNPWEAAALALALVPLAVDASSYYTEWLAALALVGHRVPRVWLALLSMVVVALGARMIVGDAEPDVAFAVASWILCGGSLAALLGAQSAGSELQPAATAVAR